MIAERLAAPESVRAARSALSIYTHAVVRRRLRKSRSKRSPTRIDQTARRDRHALRLQGQQRARRAHGIGRHGLGRQRVPAQAGRRHPVPEADQAGIDIRAVRRRQDRGRSAATSASRRSRLKQGTSRSSRRRSRRCTSESGLKVQAAIQGDRLARSAARSAMTCNRDRAAQASAVRPARSVHHPRDLLRRSVSRRSDRRGSPQRVSSSARVRRAGRRRADACAARRGRAPPRAASRRSVIARVVADA